MSDVSQFDSRGPGGRFIKGHPGGPGRPRKLPTRAIDALHEPLVQTGHSFEVAIELAHACHVTAVKMQFDGASPGDKRISVRLIRRGGQK